MGLALAPMGFYFGFNSTGLPILLAAQGVPLDKIAYVSAIGFSPTFWAFLLCPILDVRFSKRAYAVARPSAWRHRHCCFDTCPC